MFSKKEITFEGTGAILVEGLGEYDLAYTMECGQCFRYERIEREDGLKEYRTVIGSLLVRVLQEKRGELIFPELSDEDFESTVKSYFALERDLDLIRRDIVSRTNSEWLKRAASFGCGIAILKQDPWEALFSFIVSQNNNIPRIRKIIREVCAEYGVNLYLQMPNADKCPLGIIDTTPCEEKCKKCGRCYTFPTAADILARPEGLLPSHPGFRYGYLLDAAERVASGECDLKALEAAHSYSHSTDELKKIRGVGDKVASCVALFGLANLEAFPIDVWMKRAIDEYFGGVLDPTTLGAYAGIAQQYIFHYIRNGENA